MTTRRPGARPQRRMAHVLEDFAELRDMHPRASVEELAPRMGMKPHALRTALRRVRQRQRDGRPIPTTAVPTPIIEELPIDRCGCPCHLDR